jgi:lysophospholipase L1-like esterase
MNWETLMCFGDSITIGARSYCGYPEYTADFLEKSCGNNWNVINHAISGYTSMDLARYITANFNNLKQFAPGIVTVLIGTNDVKCNTSPEDFAIAYKQVIVKAMLISPSKNIVLIKIPSFPRNVAYPYTFAMNSRVETFNGIISEIAKKFKLRTLELQLSDEDLFDGVHLNAVGSAHAGRQLASFIEADRGVLSEQHEKIINLRAVNG